MVIDHPLNLPLGATIMEQIEECVVVNDVGQCNNILGFIHDNT